MTSSPRFSDLLFHFLLPVWIFLVVHSWNISFATPVDDGEVYKYFGFGQHVCNVSLDTSVFKIAILVPFDPSLLDIAALPPQDQVDSSLTSFLFLIVF